MWDCSQARAQLQLSAFPRRKVAPANDLPFALARPFQSARPRVFFFHAREFPLSSLEAQHFLLMIMEIEKQIRFFSRGAARLANQKALLSQFHQFQLFRSSAGQALLECGALWIFLSLTARL